MDKTEKFLKAELGATKEYGNLDLHAVLRDTHGQIKKRALRRKTIYSTPIVVLLMMMVYVVMPANNGDTLSPGSELFMAGFETSWTDESVASESESEMLYDQTIDYLISDQYYHYADEAEALFDAADLEALYGFLKEV